MIDYILQFFADEISFWVGAGLIAMSLLIPNAVKPCREKIKKLLACKRVRRTYIITYIILFAAAILLLFIDHLKVWVIILVFAILFAIILILWYCTLFCTPLVLFFLHRYRKLFKQGLVVEYSGTMLNNPWYAITEKDKISCVFLRCSYFIIALNLKQAYNVLESINKDNLLPKERNWYNTEKCFILKYFGANGAASKIYSDKAIKSPSDQSVLALIYEEEGRFDEAKKIFKDLDDVLRAENKVASEKYVIANNYGRSMLMSKNYIGAVDNYRNAVEYALEEKNIYGVETARDNLIMTLLKINKKEAKDVLDEHIKWLNSLPKSIWQQVCMANTMLKYAEDCDDTETIINLVEKVVDTSSSYPINNRIAILVSSGKITSRHYLPIDITEGILTKLSALMGDIIKCPMPDRFNYIRAIGEIFSQIGIYDISLTVFHDSVSDYLNNVAYNDVNEYVKQIPSYMIYENCSFKKDLARYNGRRKRDYINFKNEMLQISDIYYTEGLIIDYLHTLMEIIDEAYIEKNTSNVIDCFPVSKYEDEVKEILLKAEGIIVNFIGQPQIADLHLFFAFVYFCLNDLNKAGEHCEYFNALKIPLGSFDVSVRYRHEAVVRRLYGDRK